MENNHTNKDDSAKFLPLAVVAAGALIAGAVYWNGQNPGAAPAPSGAGGTPPAIAVNADDVKTGGKPFVGSANAPVTIIAWGDFQCPFCKRWETETLPSIMKDYVEKGKVKIVFLDFAFLGPDSTTAAEYNHAIWKFYPEKYMEWRAAMYKAQDEENGGFGDVASIDALNATIPGIDAARVAADAKVNASAYQDSMNEDRAEAQKVGLGATPSFVIGTETIQGAYPYANFKAVIDKALQ